MNSQCKFAGSPIEVRYATGLRDTSGNEAHAATYLSERLILLDRTLRRNREQHARILAHELLHFAWVRLGNCRRREWETILRCEWRSGVPGETGWSAEWRKQFLTDADVATRTRRWREYCCEAFSDTGAWLWTGVRLENTLTQQACQARADWFERLGPLRV